MIGFVLAQLVDLMVVVVVRNGRLMLLLLM
jgi:hypothetical protein